VRPNQYWARKPPFELILAVFDVREIVNDRAGAIPFDIFLRPVAACHWYSATRGRVSVRLFSGPSRGSVWRTKTSRAPASHSAHSVEARGVT
jgi:hypothetical protein